MNDWAEVSGHEGLLEVSRFGEVRFLEANRGGQRKRGGTYRPFIGNNGYSHIAPKIGASRKKLLVHRLVAMAFVPGHFSGATVNHIDGNKQNNHASNLEWVSLSENTKLQWKAGLVNLRGERHPLAKLTDADVASIRKNLEDGERVRAIATRYNVSDSLIYKIGKGEKRKT